MGGPRSHSGKKIENRPKIVLAASTDIWDYDLCVLYMSAVMDLKRCDGGCGRE